LQLLSQIVAPDLSQEFCRSHVYCQCHLLFLFCKSCHNSLCHFQQPSHNKNLKGFNGGAVTNSNRQSIMRPFTLPSQLPLPLLYLVFFCRSPHNSLCEFLQPSNCQSFRTIHWRFFPIQGGQLVLWPLTTTNITTFDNNNSIQQQQE